MAKGNQAFLRSSELTHVSALTVNSLTQSLSRRRGGTTLSRWVISSVQGYPLVYGLSTAAMPPDLLAKDEERRMLRRYRERYRPYLEQDRHVSPPA